jgi:predicted NBD/HSP70 family sugar kinase
MSMASGPSGEGRFRPGDPVRGTSQSGVRLYNERLVLSLVRRHRALPKAELARLTGLSPQTATVIVNQLEADGLLRKEEPMRGRVGQPSVPFSLNPEGAYAYGLKVGRRSADLVLVGFDGKLVQRAHTTYAYPLPERLIAFARDSVARMDATLTEAQLDRVVGLGIGTPHELWNWAYEVGSPPGALEVWRRTDLRADLAETLGRPVYVCNDATAACAAELVFGDHGGVLDFLYLFIGSFAGGGLVLNGTLVPGRAGNAAALGSMPVPDGAGGVQQLIRTASLYKLEERLTAAGRTTGWLWEDPDAWEEAEAELEAWIAEAAQSLAFTVTAATAVLDVQAVVLDGAFPARVRDRLVEAVAAALDRFDRQGLSPVSVLPGSIGARAREIGAGCLPLLANFAVDREVLFKETP